MRGLRVDDQRVPAELGNADRERDPRAQRRLVKQHCHRAWAGQRLPGEPVCLQLGSDRQHLGLFGRRQVVIAGEVPDCAADWAGHDASWPASTTLAASRITGSAAMKESASAADRISGGASRTASGWTALTRK